MDISRDDVTISVIETISYCTEQRRYATTRDFLPPSRWICLYTDTLRPKTMLFLEIQRPDELQNLGRKIAIVSLAADLAHHFETGKKFT